MGYGKISNKQMEILEYIKEEILKRGYPPAVREDRELCASCRKGECREGMHEGRVFQLGTCHHAAVPSRLRPLPG